MTDTAAEDIWADDLLDRRADAEFLLRFLIGRLEERHQRGLPRSYVLNVDAGWGKGKTYFLDRFGTWLREEKYLVANVNAWNDDHAEDPLVAVMSAIDDVVMPIIGSRQRVAQSWRSIKRTGARVVAGAARGAARHWARKALGEGADVIIEEFGISKKDSGAEAATESATSEVGTIFDERAKALLDGFKDAQRSIASFREELSGFLKLITSGKQRLPLFVLVDELDRCRPLYAIALLERVKHLFDIDNVVFVIATDTEQLRHAIGAVYGSAFDGQRYLFRFFDRTYVFEDPALQQFVVALISAAPVDENKLSLPPNEILASFISNASAFFDLSLRDVQQCFDILRSVLTVWSEPVPLELPALLPLIIGHQQGLRASLETTFLDDLKKLSDRRGDKKVWQIAFTAQTPIGQITQTHETGLAAFAAYFPCVTTSLPKFMEQDAPSGHKRWIRERYQLEFVRLHQNMYRSDRPPFSLIRKYPALVRSAGRLVPSAPTFNH
jgi:hypothetical protein